MTILIYVGIFLAKMVEVSLSTLRVVLAGRGEKLKAAVVGFFEVLIWLIVVSNVLNDVTSDPIKVVVYCVAFSCGIFLGVILEDKLAIGTAYVQAVISPELTDLLCVQLRERKFGVTVVQGQGMERTVSILMIYLKRKGVPEAIELIRQHSPTTMITVNDVRQLRNGFIRR